jgi:hypothetical protein
MRAMKRGVLLAIMASCGGAPAGPAPVAVPSQPTAVASSAPPPVVDAGRPPEEPRSLALSKDATCTLSASNAEPLEVFPLRAQAKVFARVYGKQTMEVRLLLGKSGGTAYVENGDVALTGEIELADIVVTPKKSVLQDGFWRPIRARVKSVAPDALSFDVDMPTIVRPKSTPLLALPCGDVTIAGARSPSWTISKEITLRAGVDSPLRDAPNGKIVARVVTEPEQRGRPVIVHNVRELERRGGMVRIGIAGNDVEVEGWTSATVIDPKPMALLAMLGALGGGGGTKVKPLRCAHEVPVYVHHGDEVMRAGVIKAKAEIRRMDDAPHDEVALDLGQTPSTIAAVFESGGEMTTPFVRATSIADCLPVTL